MSRMAWASLLGVTVSFQISCSIANHGSASTPATPVAHDGSKQSGTDSGKDNAAPTEYCQNAEPKKYPNYVSIETIYPDPTALVTIQDVPAALSALRKIASPTQKYHSELLRIVETATTLDASHLLLLARSTYYTARDAARIESDLAITADKSDLESCRKHQAALQDKQYLTAYATFTDSIVKSGLAKLQKLEWRTAIGILEETMPLGGASPAFAAVGLRFKPLTEERLLEMMELAERKRASQASGAFALQLFEGFSTQTLDEVIKLSAQLKDRAKDVLLSGALRNFNRLTVEEVKMNARASHNQAGRIAGRALGKVPSFSHDMTLDIMTALGDQQRGEFVMVVLNLYRSLSCEQLTSLLKSTNSHRGEISKRGLDLLSDVTATNIASVAQYLYGSSKDEFILQSAQNLGEVSSDEVSSLLNITYSARFDVAMKLIPKTKNLTVTDAIRIAKHFDRFQRDDILLKSIGFIDDLDRTNLNDLVRAASSSFASAEIEQAAELRLGELGLP